MTKPNLLVTLQFILFGGYILLYLVLPTSATTIARIIAILLAVIGMGILALGTLEHQRVNRTPPKVSPTPNQQAQLVQTGIYRFIRHPLYTAVLTVCLGMSLFHGHVLAFVLWILLVGFFTYKAMYEETLLQAVYAEYAEYMTRTGRFIPKLG